MKLLTLNTHSRPEADGRAAATIAGYITQEKIDVIALQEVNQGCGSAAVGDDMLFDMGYCALGLTESLPPIGRDNFALAVASELIDRGEVYAWTWLPIKRGYGKYDEGLSLLFRRKPQRIDAPWLSTQRSYENWRCRRALGALCGETWFYCVHTNRWDDGEEPFSLQWLRLREVLREKESSILMGDFNCPAEQRGGGYDRMLADGWHDLFSLAERRWGSKTAHGKIDGWHDNTIALPLRIDFILSDQVRSVARAETVFDGVRGEVISDHFGVMAEIKERGGSV